MHNEQFSRLLRLSRKTGDRLIVTDVEGREPVVILPLDEYEALVDGAYGLVDVVDGMPFAENEEPVLPDVDLDEADFDPEELERGALRDLWNEPLGVPPIEVMPAVAPVPDRSAGAAEQGARPKKTPESEGGEEQFYLEPI